VRQVFRCYDNRVRFTERRPDYYLLRGAEKWIHIQDSARPGPLDFGDRGDNPALTNSPGWLWMYKGQLMVLSTGFIKGKHYATSVSQLLGAVTDLEKLHNGGYVHGDIRAYNIIFGENTAQLIDFDIAGLQELSSTKYPEGYKRSLMDGNRLGVEGQQIMKREDWRALIYILFVLHSVAPVESTNGDRVLARLHEESRLFHEKDYFLQHVAKTECPSQPDIQRLKDFLWDFRDWEVTLYFDFETELARKGLLDDTTISRVATYSSLGEPTTIVS
jgi:hypothetical protein